MLRAMDSSALDTFRTFRNSLYDCLYRRADALFELTDAILTAEQVPSASPLEPTAFSPPWLGQSLQRAQPWTNRRPSSAEAARSSSACWKPNARLRRGRERMGSLRRGEQPRAGFLLSSLASLGGAADRSGL